MQTTTQAQLPFTPACAHCGKTEEWRDVVGFEGYYQVSSLGRVRSVARRVKRRDYMISVSARLLRPYTDKFGYVVVNPCKHGKSVVRKVHQLVAEAFIGPRAAGMDTDHINHNRADNRLCNLRYCTRSQNCTNTRAAWGNVPFRGVHVTTRRRSYQAAITQNGKTIYLGSFTTAVAAARAYDAKALELWGELAPLNFPDNLKRLMKGSR